jgi:nicotinamidase-related amidase
MSDEMRRNDENGESDAVAADRLQFALVGRPDRLTQLMLGGMESDERHDVVAMGEALASVGAAERPVAPPKALRARLMATLEARKARVSRKAVLVCDMINDHLVPGRTLEVPRAREVVAALAVRLDEARAAGIPVVYILDRHQPDDPDLDEWGQHAIEGTDGAAVWPALAPKPGDREVTKGSYSGFHDTSLESVLDALRIDTIELTGCATEVQLMATATDALQRGYQVQMPTGLNAGASPVAEAVAAAVLSALVPYAPARKARLERLRATV